MKGFVRDNQLLSLCGLNCGLCSMKLGGHCSGCGNGNQSCKIAGCSLEHGGVSYCFQCPEYPCDQYLHINDYDSFITHQNQKANLERAKAIGMNRYNEEQRERVRILKLLLAHYNDGRRKTFFCLAANLLPLSALQTAVSQLQGSEDLDLKERSAQAVCLLQSSANAHGILLKLRRKPRSGS